MRLSYASLNKQNFRFFAFIFIHVAGNIYQERWILRRLFPKIVLSLSGDRVLQENAFSWYLYHWWYLGFWKKKKDWFKLSILESNWQILEKDDVIVGSELLEKNFLTGNNYISRKHLINNVKSGRYLKDYWISYVLCCGW